MFIIVELRKELELFVSFSLTHNFNSSTFMSSLIIPGNGTEKAEMIEPEIGMQIFGSPSHHGKKCMSAFAF